MDKKTLEFVTFCISKLSILLKLPQEEIYSRLEKSGILYDYIIHSYDVLHTFSERYIMSDLIEYMKEKGVLSDICIDDIFKELNVAE
jgi:alanine dehydrogenase